MSASNPRARAAERLLREQGLDARVEIRGHEAEIASISLAERDRAALAGEDGAGLARRIRALGFRFVALDLGPAPDAP